MPRFIIVTGYICLALWIAYDEAVFMAVVVYPLTVGIVGKILSKAPAHAG